MTDDNKDTEKMPQNDATERRRSASADTPAVMKKVFGVFMVLIYFGMGGLTIGGFFDILFGSWHWMKWALGLLFIVYGVWRAYRYYKGRD